MSFFYRLAAIYLFLLAFGASDEPGDGWQTLMLVGGLFVVASAIEARK